MQGCCAVGVLDMTVVQGVITGVQQMCQTKCTWHLVGVSSRGPTIHVQGRGRGRGPKANGLGRGVCEGVL